MEYILFVHNNTDTSASPKEWNRFIELASSSGLFRGGSELGNRIQLGLKPVSDTTEKIVGYMLFESSNIDTLRELLNEHPVLKHGGSLELCELPKS